MSVYKASEGIAQRETLPVYCIYKKQKEIEAMSRQLKTSTEIFINQTKEWLQLIHELNSACNELGDVENALEIIHQDIKQICTKK